MNRPYAVMILMVASIACTWAVMVYELNYHVSMGTASCFASVRK